MKKEINYTSNRLEYIILPFVFILSMIMPYIVATSQYYITQYGDDIAMLYWAQQHQSSLISIFTDEIGGTGYRPMMHLWFLLGYNLWGSEPFYYYLLNGIVFSTAMIFLYLLGKTLHSRIAGIIAVMLYLFLDGSFIMVAKLGFIAFSGEILFITSALYFSIQYFKNNTDKLSMWFAISLSTLAFLSKEMSLLIIPSTLMIYLLYNKILNKKRCLILLVPFIYLALIMFVISPDVSAEKGANLTERIISNLQFYVTNELEYQFKTSLLILTSIIIAGYYYVTKQFRTSIAICVAWFIVAVAPLLITQQPVQPTYMIEANLGMVLLIGLVIGEAVKKNNLISGVLIIAIIAQLIIVPMQITNIINYSKTVADNQRTFFETVDGLQKLNFEPIGDLQNLSTFNKVYYLSSDVRTKYGQQQLREDFFQQFICIRDMCSINVTTNYTDARYVILPSTLDVEVFKKEYPNETQLIIINQVKYGNDYGFILKKGI